MYIKIKEEYKIIENNKSWKLSLKKGGLSIDYKISKVDCPTLESLQQFVAKNNLIKAD